MQFDNDTLYPVSGTATESETLHFANRVREIGGGDSIEGFFPSTPNEAQACLIANALNFDCEVEPLFSGLGSTEAGQAISAKIYDAGRGEEFRTRSAPTWVMKVYVPGVAQKIGGGLNLPYYEDPGAGADLIALPAYLSTVAQAFDDWSDEIYGYVERAINGALDLDGTADVRQIAIDTIQDVIVGEPTGWVLKYSDSENVDPQTYVGMFGTGFENVDGEE